MPHRAGLDHTSVVEAAAQLVDEEGPTQLTLGRLAERLGVRTPSLYNHITGLPGLKHDLALYTLHDLLDHITQATIGKARTDAIFALADAYRAYAKEKPWRYALTQQAPDLDDQELQVIARRLVAVVQSVLVPYALSEADAVHAVRGFRSIVHGFITLETANGFRMPIDLDASFHWLISVYIAGLHQLPGAREE